MPEKVLRGVVVPMVTPLLDDGALDAEGTERLVEHLLAGGVSGLFLLGTTGEGTNLPPTVRAELVTRVCKQAGGRAPVLVGVTDTDFATGLRLAARAAEAGAAAVVAAAPYYFALGQPELVAYYTRLAERQPLPVYLYNMPAHTKVMLEPETVRVLAVNPKIVGIKDSSANIAYFNTVLRVKEARADFAVFMGPDEALGQAVLLGADGGVNSGANVCPHLFADLYSAAAAGDAARARGLQACVLRLDEAVYTVGQYASRYVKGLKCALSLMGVCGDALTEPFDRFAEPERDTLRRRLEELGIVL
jgi:4-hydroxy-tetrahydrodipicolinate synthase